MFVVPECGMHAWAAFFESRNHRHYRDAQVDIKLPCLVVRRKSLNFLRYISLFTSHNGINTIYISSMKSRHPVRGSYVDSRRGPGKMCAHPVTCD
jgi:hypothetical protein